VIDRETGNEGSDESRYRITQRQQAEILRALGRSAELAGGVLRRHLEDHEPGADESRAEEQRGQAGKQERHRGTGNDAEGSHDHRPVRTDAIGNPPGGDGEQHRQQRVQCQQDTDGPRRGAQRQGVERNYDTAPREDRVVDHAQHDDAVERPGVAPRVFAHTLAFLCPVRSTGDETRVLASCLTVAASSPRPRIASSRFGRWRRFGLPSIPIPFRNGAPRQVPHGASRSMVHAPGWAGSRR
jgi:hypothetical protein